MLFLWQALVQVDDCSVRIGHPRSEPSTTEDVNVGMYGVNDTIHGLCHPHFHAQVHADTHLIARFDLALWNHAHTHDNNYNLCMGVWFLHHCFTYQARVDATGSYTSYISTQAVGCPGNNVGGGTPCIASDH